LCLEHRFGVSDTKVLEEFFRAHPRPVLKKTLEMKGAEMYLPGYFVQVGLIFEMSL
jgi:hypothetical protein